MKLPLLIILVLSFASGAFGQTDKDFAHLPHEQREILSKWLKSNSFYRLAVEADCTNKEGLARTRDYWGSLFYPYYKTGDFNADGTDDFAVVLIDERRRANNFKAAIFHGRVKGSYAARPAYLSTFFDLTSGGLFYHGYGKGGRLFTGSFESDGITTFVFVRNRYVEKGNDLP